MNPYDFRSFRSGPGGDMLRGLGFGRALGIANSWASLRAIIIEWNDPDGMRGPKGRFVEAVRNRDGTASSGERPLLHAIAHAMDFDWLADELAAGKSWRIMGSASGAHAAAIVACILQSN